MRLAEIYYQDVLAGVQQETEDGEYKSTYDADYVDKYPSQFLTFSMPVSKHSYSSNRLFSFFKGIIPEGWLLELRQRIGK